MNRVLKFGTGWEVPFGSLFLSTQVEKTVERHTAKNSPERETHNNTLVWHYFLVECDSKGNPPPTKEHESPNYKKDEEAE